MAGRKPLPTRLKLLRGNPGKRALNKQEPQPAPVAKPPAPPRFLGRRAATEWRRLARELVGLGLLTQIDRAALAAYCSAYAQFAEASEKLKRESMVVEGEKGSYLNPLLIAQSVALKHMKAFLIEFGMTPSSRSRVKVSEPKPVDPFDEMLGGQKKA